MHKGKNRLFPYRSTSRHLLAIYLALLGVSVFLGCGDTYETAPAEEPVFFPSDIFVDTCAADAVYYLTSHISMATFIA